MEYGFAKGTMIIKPNAYSIWENVQKILNNNFSKLNIKNVYAPMLIPKEYISMEKEHVEGFAPELATVTKIGNRDIAPLVIRPTSEILFSKLFQSEINSYNDLPKFYNQ